MSKEHTYYTSIQWTGNKGTGTSGYTHYNRSHTVQCDTKEVIRCSADPSFLGDPTRYNPEELLIASVSCCHMLWYLHLCSCSGIIVVDYSDKAQGIMVENNDGSGLFKSIRLKPVVMVTEERMIEQATALHQRANELCFIANSLRFPVSHQGVITVQDPSHI